MGEESLVGCFRGMLGMLDLDGCFGSFLRRGRARARAGTAEGVGALSFVPPFFFVAAGGWDGGFQSRGRVHCCCGVCAGMTDS